MNFETFMTPGTSLLLIMRSHHPTNILWIVMDNQLMQWTNVNIKMNANQSTYELVKQLPQDLGQVIQVVVRAINSLPACQDPRVIKDLDNYKGCLAKLETTCFRATDSLLSKPRVAAALKGEIVTPGMEDALGTAKQQILELSRLVEAMERPELPAIPPVADLISW